VKANSLQSLFIARPLNQIIKGSKEEQKKEKKNTEDTENEKFISLFYARSL
jgi:transcriptional regulator of nitric oxide reductase